MIFNKYIKEGVNLMKVIPAAEAKTNFGALLDSAQREPVTILEKYHAIPRRIGVTNRPSNIW